jgi:hypothetical protein
VPVPVRPVTGSWRSARTAETADGPLPAFFIMNPYVSIVIPVLADAEAAERLIDQIDADGAV